MWKKSEERTKALGCLDGWQFEGRVKVRNYFFSNVLNATFNF